MKHRITPVLLILMASTFIGISGCNQSETDTQPETLSIHTVPIELDIASILTQMYPGDDVSPHVSMFKSTEAYLLQEGGEANLSIEVTPGDEIIWKLVASEGHVISLEKFHFELLEGENFFAQTDGYLPQKQSDGSWKAKVSSHALDGSKLKYSIYILIDGENYWWDPLISNRSNP